MRAHRFTFTECPPTLNNSTAVFNGRKIKSAAYRKWHSQALLELSSQPGALPELCYWSSHILIPGTITKADLDNLPKALHDVLGDGHRSPNDRYLVKFTAEFYSGNLVIIAIKQEDLQKWSAVKKPSPSLYRKMELSMNLKLAL